MKILKENDIAKIYQNNIYQNNDIVAWAIREQVNLYTLLFRTVVVNVNATNIESLGHVNTKTLLEMRNKGLVNGVNFDDVENFFYEGCAYGKQHRLPFKNRDSNVKKSKISQRNHLFV